jgi:hypothetical protein
LEAVIGDLLGGGVNLTVVIAMEFLIKDPLSVFNIGHIFADAGSDQPVLEPTVGSFNFASGLRGKGMSDVHIAVLENLFPLRRGLIGQKMVFIPEGISSPDISEDRVRIDIVVVRKAISKDDGL